MPDGRGARLALEAGFLVVVAAVLVAASLRPVWIVLVMLLAWVIVALLEWAAFREQPHWASGLPPRYYVPEQPLPPRPPGIELPAFSTYPRPAPREPEAATWIATPQMREEVLGWPASGLGDTEEAAPAEEPQTTVEEMPEELLAEAAAIAAPVEDEGGWPVAAEPVEDPWFVAELPAEPIAPDPEPELVAPEPEPELVAPEPEPELELAAPEPEPPVVAPEPPEPEVLAPDPEPVAVAPASEAAAPRRPARHRLDPFAEPPARRWRARRADGSEDGLVELPPLPSHVRLEPRERAGRES